jgi:hypothetical protein
MAIKKRKRKPVRIYFCSEGTFERMETVCAYRSERKALRWKRQKPSDVEYREVETTWLK